MRAAQAVVDYLRTRPAIAAVLPPAHAATVAKGVYRRGAVPPGVAHPVVVVDEVGGPIRWSLDRVPVVEEYAIPVTVEHQQTAPTVPASQVEPVVDALEAELDVANPTPAGWLLHHFRRDVNRSWSPPITTNGVTTITSTLRYEWRVSKF